MFFMRQISQIKSKISAFESQVNILHEFGSDSPVTEPYEELQQEIQVLSIKSVVVIYIKIVVNYF